MKEKKNASFWRKNAYYIIIAVCATAIIAMSTYAIINMNDKTPVVNIIDDPGQGTIDPDPVEPVDTVITFAMPMSTINVIKDYTDTVCANLTTGDFRGHMAVDFGGTAGDNVYAVYGGTIFSNTKDAYNGTTIVIDHGSGLKTIYKSLTEQGTLKAGDVVKKGDVIGTISTSYSLEYSDGAHLHFEVIENGLKINPSKYLVYEEK